MQHTFLIAPTDIKTGLTSITIGMIRALDQLGLKVAVCKPVTRFNSEAKVERTTALISHATGLDHPKPMSLKHAQQMFSSGQQDRLMEEVIALHHKIAKDADVVLVEGIEPDRSEPYTTKLNVEMAKTLDAEVILVSAPAGRSPRDLRDHIELGARMYGGINHPKLLGCVINKINAPKDPSRPIKANEGNQLVNPIPASTELAIEQYATIETDNFKVIGLIPWEPNLVAPRVSDVAQYLGATALNPEVGTDNRISRISICARTLPNMVNALQPGTLIVTPGDRDDILLAAAMASANGVPLAGVLLTSGLDPDPRVFKLLQQSMASLPILSVATDTYQTASQLSHMEYVAPADDNELIERIMDHAAMYVDAVYLKDRCQIDHIVRLSPAAFRYKLVTMAQQAGKRVVLPEGEEPRTIQAAIICQNRGIANCILLGKPDKIEQVAESLGVQIPEALEIMDPDAVRERYIEPMVELRKHKNLTAPMAEAQLEDSVVMGTMMLALDEVDGLVSGAVHTTANTIRPALQLIKTAPNAKLVSSVFFMLLPEQVMVYGDCAVNPDPNADELADIALQSADSAAAFGIDPKVAMISYSTGSSGSGSDVEKVRAATGIAQKARPDLLIDGPLQYDAATTANVARSKAPDSKVAGKATVVVFPDLNTGNTTYKAVQRSANVVSIGPMLQGLAKPVNDLSRGALVEDIVYTIALTAIQAASRES